MQTYDVFQQRLPSNQSTDPKFPQYEADIVKVGTTVALNETEALKQAKEMKVFKLAKRDTLAHYPMVQLAKPEGHVVH